MKAQVRNGAFLVLLAVLVSLPAWPQATGTAALSGTVMDPTGAVISGAEVKATQESTGVVRTASTDAAGKYFFAQLPPSKYKIEVKMSGFKTAVLQRVDLLVGTSATLDVHLEIGALAEEVVVEGGAAMLNVTDATLGNPLSGAEVESLPAIDRNPAGLLSLQTGVTYVANKAPGAGGYGGVSDDDGRSGAVNGARSDQTNITLDGVDCNDPTRGYAFTCVTRPTQASLAEFRTVTTNYSPEAGGRSSGAQIQMVTKSGTNELHGEAYYLHRNEVFNANDFFLNSSGQKEPMFRRHLYGAAVGGPVVKDRFFLFGNWERMEETLFESVLRDVPSAAYKDGVFFYNCSNPACDPSLAGDFSGGFVQGISGTLYGIDTSSGEPCAQGSSNCGPVPNGIFGMGPNDIQGLDPLGLGVNPAVLTNWATIPDPNDHGESDGLNNLGFRFGAPVSNTFNTYILKADVNITRDGKHTIFWRGTLQDDVVVRAPQFPGLPPNERNLAPNRGFALGYTALLKPTLINNLRWGFTRLKNTRGGNQTAEFVDFRFFSNSQDFDSNTDGRTIPQHHIRDDVSWTRGKHALSFGGEGRWTRNSKFSNASSFNNFFINPSWTNDGGRQIQPGSSTCTAANCSIFPRPSSRSERDLLFQILGPISQVTGNYNYTRDGTVLGTGDPVARKFAVDEYELYFQDQWRMTPSLTVTLGLRYFLRSPPWEMDGNQVQPTPSLGSWFECRAAAMADGRPSGDCGTIEFALGGPANGGRNYYNWDMNNLSPRLAIAWAPRYKGGVLGWLTGDGKMSIRAGYSIVYDRMGNGIVNTFDELGSFGMSTSIDSVFGGCAIATGSGSVNRPPCARFSGIFDTGAAAAQSLVPAPPAVFPSVAPSDLLSVSVALDDRIKTPYAYTGNLSIARELPWNMVVETSYVWRHGLRLLLPEDFAMPADLQGPGGVSGFAAAREFIQVAFENSATQADLRQSLIDVSTLIGPNFDQFWSDLFPGFGPTGVNGGCLEFDIFDMIGNGFPACGYTATQVAYDYMIGYHGTAFTGSGFGTSTFWQDVDYFGFPAFASCSSGSDLDGDGFPDCPHMFFPPQWVNLNTWSTVGRSEYDAFQLNVRKRMSHGIQFTVNYTLSKSLDQSSTPERTGVFGGFNLGAGYSGFALNTWNPHLSYGVSDYYMRHQVNAYWSVELPFGRGRAYGGDWPGWANQIAGGWQLSGIFRANSGLPANILNGRTWPTNWDFQGNGTCAPASANNPQFSLENGPCPATHTVHGPVPNMFPDAAAALQQFRFTGTGEIGQRNVLRGDKYMNIDFGIRKEFSMPWEGQKFELRWDVFNLFNSVYFDTAYLNGSIEDPATFGQYTDILGAPRRMQLSLRYTF